MALSTPEVTISSNFTGTTVTLFGVIDLAGAVSRVGGPIDVAVLLIGPPQTVIARRKDRFLGIWANAAAETFSRAPAFYSLSTSAPIDEPGVAGEPRTAAARLRPHRPEYRSR